MVSTQRAMAVALVLVASTAASSCGTDGTTTCVANDVGEVCANNRSGAITFTGQGLEPNSDVRLDSSAVEPIVYEVRADGTFEPGGGGVLSTFANTEFTFTVAAVDADGNPLEGDIVIRSG